MKIKNVIEGIGREKSNNVGGGGQAKFIRKFMFLLCLIFILLLVYLVGVLILNRDAFRTSQNAAVDPSVYFRNCKVLQENCSDVDCNFYSSCGDGGHKACKIYDCGDSYGIYTQDLQDKIDIKKEAKYDAKAVQAKKDACSGSMQVLEQKCVDKKMQVKVKLAPKGECKIGGFTLIYEGAGAQSNTFAPLGDNTYSIAADTCGKITEIIPATEEGISLGF